MSNSRTGNWIFQEEAYKVSPRTSEVSRGREPSHVTLLQDISTTQDKQSNIWKKPLKYLGRAKTLFSKKSKGHLQPNSAVDIADTNAGNTTMNVLDDNHDIHTPYHQPPHSGTNSYENVNYQRNDSRNIDSSEKEHCDGMPNDSYSSLDDSRYQRRAGVYIPGPSTITSQMLTNEQPECARPSENIWDMETESVSSKGSPVLNNVYILDAPPPTRTPASSEESLKKLCQQTRKLFSSTDSLPRLLDLNAPALTQLDELMDACLTNSRHHSGELN